MSTLQFCDHAGLGGFPAEPTNPSFEIAASFIFLLLCRLGSNQLGTRPCFARGIALCFYGGGTPTGETPTAAKCIDCELFRKPPFGQLFGLKFDFLVVDGLVYGLRNALSPNHQCVRAILALPPIKGGSAGRAAQRRIRDVFIEHAHLMATSTEPPKSKTDFCI